MKLLIGTLKTIENEFKDCCNSINSQPYNNFDHVVIENLGDAEAHDRLYSNFQENSDKYDLLIKIDADMIIADNHLFKKIAKEFVENKTLDRLFIPVYDHFVGENLGGVNIYRNTVKWRVNEDNFFTDRGHIEETIRETRKWNPSVEEPLIHHCPNPSNYQAFHFGFHRMMKVLQPNIIFANRARLHWKSIRKIYDRYNRNKSMNLLQALMGADCAIAYDLKGEDISYQSKKVEQLFDEYQKKVKSNSEHLNELCGSLSRIYKLPIKIGFWKVYIEYRIKAILANLKQSKIEQ